MKLQHYLGGLEGLDAIAVELGVFVEAWEKRIFGIHTAMMGLSSQLPLPQTGSGFRSVWTWADLRKGAEAMNPFDYFKFRYYEKWLGGICGYFVEHGYITEQELQAKTAEFLAEPSRALPAGGTPDIDARILQYLLEGDSPRRPASTSARLEIGQAVVVKDVATVEHTRLPGYLRGKIGTIETVYDGDYAYLCSTGTDGVGPPMPVYCVRFDPRELWPGNAESDFFIYADLYATYVAPLAAGAGGDDDA